MVKNNIMIFLVIGVLGFLFLTSNTEVTTQSVVFPEEPISCQTDDDCPKCFGRQITGFIETNTTGQSCIDESECGFAEDCVGQVCVDELNFGNCVVDPDNAANGPVCQISEYCIDSGEVERFFKDRPLQFARNNPVLVIGLILLILGSFIFLKK